MKKIIYLIVPVLVLICGCGHNSESDGTATKDADNTKVDMDSTVIAIAEEVASHDTIKPAVSDDKTESVAPPKEEKVIWIDAWSDEAEERYQKARAVRLAKQDSLKAVLAELEAIIASVKNKTCGSTGTPPDSIVEE